MPMRAKYCLIAFLILVCSRVVAQSVRLDDASDWWSINNGKHDRPDGATSAVELASANFRIAGTSIDDGFEKIMTKLGHATLVHRGDASTSRTQACYVSSSAASPVHFVFEGSEGEQMYFYLFEGGANWKGSELCKRSHLVSNTLRTASGLRIGLTRKEVEAILGKPDLAADNRIFYDRNFKLKTTPRQFRMLRKGSSRLTDKEAHREFDYIELGESVEAQFTGSRLTYLAVSKLVPDFD
jgi:hypothetical protein